MISNTQPDNKRSRTTILNILGGQILWHSNNSISKCKCTTRTTDSSMYPLMGGFSKIKVNSKLNWSKIMITIIYKTHLCTITKVILKWWILAWVKTIKWPKDLRCTSKTFKCLNGPMIWASHNLVQTMQIMDKIHKWWIITSVINQISSTRWTMVVMIMKIWILDLLDLLKIN